MSHSTAHPAPAAGVRGPDRGALARSPMRPRLPDSGDKAESLLRLPRSSRRPRPSGCGWSPPSATSPSTAPAGPWRTGSRPGPGPTGGRCSRRRSSPTPWTSLAPVAAALADGRMHLDQARASSGPRRAARRRRRRDRAAAEHRLVADAEQFGPPDLARLGSRVLDVIAPRSATTTNAASSSAPSEGRGPDPARLQTPRRRLHRHCRHRPRRRRRPTQTYLEAFTSPRQHSTAGDGSTPPPASGRPPTGNAAMRSAPPRTPRPDSCPTTVASPPP